MICMDFKDIAVGLISRDPRFANNPQAQNYLRIIQSGDAQQGEQIARNLCQTYGVTPDQAVQQARSFFHL